MKSFLLSLIVFTVCFSIPYSLFAEITIDRTTYADGSTVFSIYTDLTYPQDMICTYKADGTPHNGGNGFTSGSPWTPTASDMSDAYLTNASFHIVDDFNAGDECNITNYPDVLGLGHIDSDIEITFGESFGSTNLFSDAVQDQMTSLTTLNVDSMGTVFNEQLKTLMGLFLAFMDGLWPAIVGTSVLTAVFVIANWGRKRVI